MIEFQKIINHIAGRLSPLLWRGKLLAGELPYKEGHVATNLECPLADSKQKIEALSLVACKELNTVKDHMSL